ncbi:MAG: type II toxin-antitoxin system PemK/MazF family toxin [Lachnospiraceae bacterium]|nr:type II toxin-antitoxin system PemK/MazF family toxin [Lachnospiraceae bacterium]
MEHERAEIFKRGQVWYWEDPIYQSKDRGLKIDIGEAGKRYSRYVVIIQDPQTASKYSIAVIPCSSKNGAIHDVEIPIDQLHCDQHSYAKVQSIMTVHPRSLVRYVCTIPDEALKAIDAEMIKMFAPYLRKVCSDEEIMGLFGIDMGVSTIGWYQHHHENIGRYVNAFVKTSLIETGREEDRVSVKKLKDAFDLFCLKRGYILDYDIIELIDSLCHISDPTKKFNLNNEDSSLFDITGFSGCLLADDATNIPFTVKLEKVEPAPEEPTVVEEETSAAQDYDIPITEDLRKIVTIGIKEEKFIFGEIMYDLRIPRTKMHEYADQLMKIGVMVDALPKRPKGINLEKATEFLKFCDEYLAKNPEVNEVKHHKKPFGYWTVERKHEFIRDVQTIGIKQAADKYGITIHAAETYASKWKKNNTGETSSEKKPNPESDEVSSIPEFPPRIDNINRGVSALSNIITDFLRHNNSYSYYNGTEYSEADFYSKLSTTIYYGTLQYMNVFIPRGGKPKLPKDEVIAKNIDLWWFVSMLHNDMALNGMKDFDKICEIYQDRYHKPTALPVAIIEMLKNRIVRFGLLSDTDTAKICSLIEQRFCR